MRRQVYVTNTELLAEIRIYWDTGKYSNKLVLMIQKMVTKIANSRNFYGYEFKHDMMQEGIIHALYKGIPGFKKDKKNPFSFLSTVIVNKYLEIIKKEKKNIIIKNVLKEQEIERVKQKTQNRI